MSRHPNPENRCTPVAEWPSLDGAAWALALEPAGPFEPASGYALRWSQPTRAAIQGSYGRWLGWLERSGLLDASTAPGQRVSRERVRDYVAMLRDAGNADNTVAGRLQQLCNALTAMEPEGDWQWIHRASSRLFASAKPVRDIVARMQPAEDVIALGFDMMRAATEDRFRTPCDRATLFRDGLIVAFLVMRPLRSANLAAITLGRHLERRGEAWRLRFEPDETKTAVVIECAWPAELDDALELYLEVHRPRLLAGAKPSRVPTQGLWVSRQGTAMTSDAIAYQIEGRTKEEFGTAINPHTFRHIAATTIATSNPAGATDIMTVLGHSNMRMSEKHYNRAQMLAAASSLQGTIGDMRKPLRKGRRANPGL